MPKKRATTPPQKKTSSVGVNDRNPKYWLLKSEPDVFSIDDLAAAKNQTTCWDGVRNYQARNTLRDDMKLGDLVLFYHSNANPPGIAGLAKVVRESYPDHTAWDPHDAHFDPKTNQDHPTWMMVDIQFVEKFSRELSLSELREIPQLSDMVLLRKGSRLSVQPVTRQQYATIVATAHASTAP